MFCLQSISLTLPCTWCSFPCLYRWGLCRACYSDLNSEIHKTKSPSVFRQNQMDVFSLWLWTPGQSDRFSAWIHSLKDPRRHEIWGQLAEDWDTHMTAKLMFPEVIHNKRPVWVPAPTSRKISGPHLWAHHFQKIYGGRVWPHLFVQGPSQRQLNRHLRLRRKIQCRESFTFEPHQEVPIFVDDILTTGSTATNSRKVLGLSHLDVWVLARRRRLAAPTNLC